MQKDNKNKDRLRDWKKIFHIAKSIEGIPTRSLSRLMQLNIDNSQVEYQCEVNRYISLTLELEADKMFAAKNYIGAQHSYLEAATALKSVPRTKTLKKKLLQKNRKCIPLSSTQMLKYKSEPISITKFVRQSISLIEHHRENPVPVWIHSAPSLDWEDIESSSKERILSFPLRSIFSGIVYTSNQKVRRASNYNLSDPEISPDLLNEEMMQTASLYMQLNFQSHTKPQLNWIRVNYDISYGEIFENLIYFDWVPKNRLEMISQAILNGFKGAMSECLGVLIPQFEFCILNALNRIDQDIEFLEEDGHTQRRTLGALLSDDSGILMLLDENTVKTLRFIFTENWGYNLRNRWAHGEVSSGFSQSDIAMISFHSICKLLFSPWKESIEISTATCVEADEVSDL